MQAVTSWRDMGEIIVSKPLFSIVIPTYARPHILRECLTAVSRLDGRETFEVIVVDDGSPEPVNSVVDAFSETLPIRLLQRPRGGPALARNTGANAARGRYLAFTDDDCRPAPDWLTALGSAFERDDRRLLGGRVENALVHNAYSEASERIGQFVYDYNRHTGAHEPFFTANNFAVCAKHFHDVGGFTSLIPSATAEDKEFCDRWRAHGLPLAHVPDAVVFHAHHLSFRGFMRQHYNYGRGILAFRLLRRGRGNDHRVVPEPLTFYLDLLTSPLRHPSPTGRWRLVALLACSQLATVAGALVQLLQWRQLKRVRSTTTTEA